MASPEINLNPLYFQELRNTLQKEKKTEAEQKALLVHLSHALQDVTDALSGKVVHPNFQGGPTNSQMQQAMGNLMDALAEMECVIAKWGNEKTQLNARVGNAFVKEMQKQADNVQKETEKTLKEIAKSKTTSLLVKIFEGIAAALLVTLSAVCPTMIGPEIAGIVAIFSTLSISGGMDKAITGIATLIAKIIPGISQDLAHLLASMLVIIVSIAVTAMTCGGGASTVAEEVTDEAAGSVENSFSSPESFQDLLDKISEGWNDCKNAVESGIKQTFGKLPRSAQLALLAGAMATENSGFAEYTTKLILAKMPNGGEKEALSMAIKTLISLSAALVGFGAAVAASSFSVTTDLSSASRFLVGLQYAMLAAGCGQATAQFAQAGIQGLLAGMTLDVGETQSTLSLLQALIKGNANQLASDTRTLGGQLGTRAQGIATLTADLNKEEQALSHILRG